MAIASCTGKEAIEPDEKSDASRIINDETTVIPVEDALEYLNDFLADTKMIATKSGDARQIASVETHYSETKADIQGSALPDAYLVNFKNDAGFAVLGANTSVDPIIAVIEEGNTDWDAITNPRDEEPSSFEEDCPDPGVKPDQILSACVKNALENEFIPEIATKYGPYSTEVLPLTTSQKFNQQVTYCHKPNRGYVLNGCASTAISIIAAYNDFPCIMADTDDIRMEKCNAEDGEGLFCSIAGRDIFVTLNDYFTNHTEIPAINTTEQMADIITRIDPGVIKTHGPISKFAADTTFTKTRFKLASAIYYGMTNIVLGWNGTGAMPGAVTNCLKTLYYTDVNTISAKRINNKQIQAIKDMLNNSKPVIMCGYTLSISGLKNSHYWVVDGIREDTSGTYLSCNWGWGGSKNGWYSIYCLSPGSSVAMEAETKTVDTQNDWQNLVVYTYNIPSEKKYYMNTKLFSRRQKYE